MPPRLMCRTATALLLAATGAHSACLPPLYADPVIRVGDTATDAQCNYDSIQDAINAAGDDPTCPTVIAVTREHIWSHQNLTVANRSVWFIGQGDGVTCGAVATCNRFISTCPTTAQTTLSASGSGRVLTISGNSTVLLDGMAIIGGNTGADGGGINFTGSGKLVVRGSTIANNNAGYGGGIDVNGSGGNATLVIGSNTFIDLNTAGNSGGGVRIEGTTRLLMLDVNSPILLNTATNGYGGGIEIIGPARADLGATGIGDGAAISSNDGKYGAGIAVLDNGNGEAVLRTFAHDPTHPFRIDNNTGADEGGGLYASGVATACLFATRITGNAAAEGAAIHEVSSGGIFVNANSQLPSRLGSECGPESVADLGGSTVCSPADCSALSGNSTQDSLGNPVPGHVVFGAHFTGSRFRMQNNTAKGLFYMGEADLDLSRCLFTDNILDSYAVYGSGGLMRTRSCTIAQNSIGGKLVFDAYYAGSAFDLENSIIAQPGYDTVHWSNTGSATFNVDYVLTNSTAGLPQNNPSVVQGAPQFVDAAHGDFHLTPVAQAALDFGASTLNNIDLPDLDGHTGIIDLAVPNYLPGFAVDLGAYERQNLFFGCGTAESIYCDGFDR